MVSNESARSFAAKVVSSSMVVAQFGEVDSKGLAFRSSDGNKTNAESPRKTRERRLETRILIKDSDGFDTEPLQRASYGSAGATENNLERPGEAVERRLETWTLIKDSGGCDTQPLRRVSHVSAGEMEKNLHSPRKAVEPGTKAAVRVIRSDQGDSQRAGRSSDGPPLSLCSKKARVEKPNLEGRRDLSLSELIAEATKKKKRLRVDSLGTNPDARSLKKSVLSNSSPIRHGERQKNVSSDANSKPGMLTLQNNVSYPNSKPDASKKFTQIRPQGGGLSESQTNVSAARKSNEPLKFAGKKLVDPALIRKQKQDAGPTSLSLSFKKQMIQMPWHKALELALDTGRAVLLQNLDPGFSSCEVETMLTELLSVSCEARMQPPKDFSCYTSGEALVLFQSRREAEGALIKLTENVLIWSEDQRPVVASLARKDRHEKNCFRGFMSLCRSDHRNGELLKTGGASSHCSQPNTVIFEMGMEWRLLQDQQSEAWNLAAQLNES